MHFHISVFLRRSPPSTQSLPNKCSIHQTFAVLRRKATKKTNKKYIHQRKRHKFTSADWKGSASLLYSRQTSPISNGIQFTPMGAFKKWLDRRTTAFIKKEKNHIKANWRRSCSCSPPELFLQLQLSQLWSVSLSSLVLNVSQSQTLFLSPLSDSSRCFRGDKGDCRVRSLHPFCPNQRLRINHTTVAPGVIQSPILCIWATFTSFFESLLSVGVGSSCCPCTAPQWADWLSAS